MKKLFNLLAITFIAVTANAQWFIGGGMGLSATVKERPKEKIPYYGTIDKKRDYLVGINIAPKMGYYFNDKLAFGLEPSIGVTFANTLQLVQMFDGTYQYIEYDGTFINWRIAPFLRYTVFTHKKFAFMLEGNIGIGGRHEVKYNNYSIIGVGVLNIVPVLGYKLTDCLQLETTLNFLNLGYNIDIYIAGSGYDKSKMIVHDLNIGFNAKSVFAISQLTVGIIYKFN
jgi:hypothetical protein